MEMENCRFSSEWRNILFLYYRVLAKLLELGRVKMGTPIGSVSGNVFLF